MNVTQEQVNNKVHRELGTEVPTLVSETARALML